MYCDISHTKFTHTELAVTAVYVITCWWCRH